MKRIWCLFLLCLWGACPFLVRAQDVSSDSGHSQATGKTTAPSSIWDESGVADFSFKNRTGEIVTRDDLRGKQWVAGFIFTRCKGPCPNVVMQMKLLQEQTGVTLVTFSVDPEFDTPEVLSNFARDYQPKPKPSSQDPKLSNGQTGATVTAEQSHKWYWLTGNRSEIYKLIMGSFKMPVARNPQAPDGFDVIHSNNLMHVDEQGRVLGKYNAMEGAEMALLRRILQGKAPRGRMMQSLPSVPTGEKLDIEGLPPGFTISRPTSEDGLDSSNSSSGSGSTEVESQTGVSGGKVIPQWVHSLPAVNASLNGLATVLLLVGFALIKGKRIQAHKWTMLASFGVSVLFLGCYLIYHYYIGSKRFPGTGVIRVVYLLILVTHIVLAATVPFLASITIYRGLKGQFDRHRAIARITFPIWVYVSVTGVVIYLMLYHYPVAQ